MFNTLKHHWQLRKLFKEKSKTATFYAKLRKEAEKSGKSHDEIHGLRGEEGFDVSQIDEKIKSVVTSRLCKIATRLLLPIPDHNDKTMWERSDKYSPYTLTPKGVSELRSTIRKELKERRENAVLWIAAITGLIGAITGLIAIVTK